MSLRDAYQQKLQAHLQEHKARLDLLRAKAKRAAAQSKILAYEEIGNADKHLADAKAKLRTFADAGGGAFAEIKSGVSRALTDLKTASKRAAEHLRANMATTPSHSETVPRRPTPHAVARARAAARMKRPTRAPVKAAGKRGR
jgi:hypothetical protein